MIEITYGGKSTQAQIVDEVRVGTEMDTIKALTGRAVSWVSVGCT